MAFDINIKELVSSGNVRSDVDAELAPSIKENGVLIPLEVYRQNGSWVIKDGHRRFMGAVVAGLEVVPCDETKSPMDEAGQLVEQYVINQHRKGLSYLDQAQFYYRLRFEFGFSQKAISLKCGVSEAEVSLALSALRAHPTVRDALLEGKISPSAAEIVTSMSIEDQAEIAPAVVKAKTVQKIRDLVNTYKKTKQSTGTRAVTVEKEELDVDPMEVMAVDALEVALKNLKIADTAIISDPKLRTRALKAVAEITKITDRFQSYLEQPVEEYAYEEA